MALRGKEKRSKRYRLNNKAKEQSSNPYLNNLFRWLIWALPVFVALFLLLFRLSAVAGLHRDEATFGLFAEQIQDGLRPLRGYFNTYTAPIHSYIIALFFTIFDESIWSLRLSGILLNILAVTAYIDVVRRMFPKQALWTFWFLITLPAFVVLARIAGENYALNPFFLFSGIWAYYVLGLNGSSKSISRTGFFLTGLAFFLGCWNHIVFLPTAVSIIIAYLIFSRTKLNRIQEILPWFISGIIIGAIPKLYGVLVLGYDIVPSEHQISVAPLFNSFLNLIYTLGGDALYIRACGKIIFSFNWFLPLCLIISAAVIFRKAIPSHQKRFWLAVTACFILSFLGTWLITPNGMIGSRHWLLALWLVPLLLALSLPESNKWLRTTLGILIILINLSALGLNYFYNFLQTGGIPLKSVYVGGVYDNSWDFIDLRSLVKTIALYNDKPIYIEDYNIHRLMFLLPEYARSRARLMNHILTDKEIPLHSLLLFYRLSDRPFPSTIKTNNVIAKINTKLSDSHYIVFEVLANTYSN